MSAVQQKTSLRMWLKRYAVNIPVALLMLAMALASHEGLRTPSSTPAAVAQWLIISPDYISWLFVLGGLGAMLAPSRNALFAITALLFAYAVATLINYKLSAPDTVPSGAWVQQIFLFFFAAAWALYGRPFPDDQLVRGLEKDLRGEAQDVRGAAQDARGGKQDVRGGAQDARGNVQDQGGREGDVDEGGARGSNQ